MTDGLYAGQPIYLAMQFDTAKPTSAATSLGYLGFYEWATHENNWVTASGSIGNAAFDLNVNHDTDESLMLADEQLGASSDLWDAFYLGRRATPITPFLNGYADALLMNVRLVATLTNDGDFISGIGKEQEFAMLGDSLGIGRIDLSFSVVHQFDGSNWSQLNMLPLSSISGDFNITAASSHVNVPEPSSIALFGIGLLATWTLRRKRVNGPLSN
jgi:hypothetical protein